MAIAASKDVEKGNYYQNFFAASLRSQPTFKDEIAESFTKISNMASGTNQEYIFEVTCKPSKFCSDPSYYAHMGDDRQTMNFCDSFFAPTGEIKGTNDRTQDCQSMTLKEAHRSKAAVLVHEMTHTRYAMLYEDPALDYAYGFTTSYQLALGVFDRSCAPWIKNKKTSKILCPKANGEEGVCDEKYSGKNADSFALVAAGIYFSEKCNRAIPLPPLPTPIFVFNPTPVSSVPIIRPSSAVGSGASVILLRPSIEPTKASSMVIGTPVPRFMPRNRRNEPKQALNVRASCPVYDDYIAFDDSREEIVGYVHFGDSYGAGMGTGTTTTDGCRVGENNYGKLLHNSWKDGSIPFENKVCSGDTTKGLNRQIDEWKDPKKANIGTVSMGGNDLGFSDLVYYCIITPNTARLGSTNRKNCLDAEKKAQEKMNDQGADGMKAKLKAAYLRILEKAGRSDFQLYATSYVGFFNFDTTDCDKSTFHYWWAAYNPPSDWPLNRIVYLTRDLRREIDGLVMGLNKVIEEAVSEANAEHGGQQIHYVDVNGRFMARRWCEQGDWHEPAPKVDTTWFFLSGWPDVSIEVSSANTAAVEAAEVESLISAGRIPVPDANCRATLDSDADPYVRAMCYLAEAVAENRNGTEARYLDAANAEIKEGNVTSQHIGYFTPTRQIKTFHPRSPGMVAYRDAVIESIANAGQF
ncbi:SGNH hydrolase-type esterase domain-containing protein [Pyrenochaeta sp. MPI-SDFR-AT-0127]|nr:SGNH hydrolase-type esterase domain-containing protein [Pyrenochaeta sp. MPI-SDFR-AT-0127]